MDCNEIISLTKEIQMFKKIIALFLFTQAVQAYSCYRLNTIANQLAAANDGTRPVVLTPRRGIEKFLITFATDENVDLDSIENIPHINL